MSQFNPLSGTELLEVIIADIRKIAEESGEFSPNLAYPWIKYSYEIKLTTYPKRPIDAEPETVVAGGANASTDDLDPQAIQEPEVVLSSGDVIIDTPDQARVDADLPLPTAVPVVNVGIVDKPIRQQTKKGK